MARPVNSCIGELVCQTWLHINWRFELRAGTDGQKDRQTERQTKRQTDATHNVHLSNARVPK